MSAYTSLCAGLLFPLHEWFKGHETVRVRRRLEESQWWTPERLRSYQIERLRTFLDTIGRQVPYFREVFKRAGFDPKLLSQISDLQHLPRQGKPEIRANAERLKAEGARLAVYNTGGSSGEPLVFFIGRERRSHDVAAKWRATRWWGVDIGDPEIVVWGSPIELKAQDRIRALRDALMRSWLLPAFDMSPASLDRYVAAIRMRRPRMLFGYPSSLALIAEHARRRQIRMDSLGVKVAFVTSECLYQDQRETIESVFGCRIANGYGGRDAGFIAHECPSGSMHITAEDIIVEILDEDGRPARQGEAGEIVVTHMATSEFPFVRYRTGDIGVLDPSPCDCGRGLPLLKEIQGRSTDFVVAVDGTVIHALALIYVIRGISGVRQFKIIQKDATSVEVLLVRDAGYSPSNDERIRQEFKQRLGSSVAVSIVPVESIPREASGKFRYVVSNVDRHRSFELNGAT